MNIDFHLYGTYTAAVIAGCNNEQAKKIAFSAQMVDDFTQKISPDGFTATSMPYIAKIDSKALLNKDVDSINEVVNICTSWMVFHFVPGITAPDLLKEDKNGTITNNSALFCALGGKAVNYLTESEESPIYGSLVSLGIGCHMYADIYAHMCFSGLVTRKPTLVKQVYILDGPDNKECELPYFCTRMPSFTKDVLPGGLFMGHGLAGHYPDISTVKLKYTWISKEGQEAVYVKDNTEYFALAFAELIRVIQKGHNLYTNERIVDYKKVDYKEVYKNVVEYLQQNKQQKESMEFNNRYSVKNDNSFKELLDYRASNCDLKNTGIQTSEKLLEEYEAYKAAIEEGEEDKELFEASAQNIKINMLENICYPGTNDLINISEIITNEFN